MRRQHYRQHWVERIFLDNRTLACVLVLVGMAMFQLLWPIARKKQELQQEITIVNRDINEVRLWRDYLEQQIDMLQNDPEHIERLARDKLGLVRQDEIVYQILDSTPR